MRWEEAKKKADSETWAFLELRPTGKIETKEQYDYAVYYAEHKGLSGYLKPFEESKGKYLKLGSWFGGASFYLYCGDNPDNVDGHFGKDAPVYDEFSYGKFGRIEFE